MGQSVEVRGGPGEGKQTMPDRFGFFGPGLLNLVVLAGFRRVSCCGVLRSL